MKRTNKGLVHLIIGLQWGDEGKGKTILDLLERHKFKVNARYQGGCNAGHSLRLPNGDTFVAHTLPSGVLVKEVELLLGNNMVIDPVKLTQEIDELATLGYEVWHRLYISKLATLITPYHKLLDKAAEWSKGKKIGTTGSGIGPAYADTAARTALKVGMVLDENFEEILKESFSQSHQALKAYIDAGFDFSIDEQSQFEQELENWKKHTINLRHKHVIDMSKYVQKLLADGVDILAEGAQGVMLDVQFGDYPYTTSSTTTAHGVFTGLGIGPTNLGAVYGVMKPYVTKVGGGPFPSQISDPAIEALFQEEGGEVGATTGRKRMCGYVDLVVLRHAIQLHIGFGQMNIIMTKVDIFPDTVTEMPVITEYIYAGDKRSKTLQFPLSAVTGVVKEKTIIPWKVPTGTTTYNGECAGLDVLIGFIHSELNDIRDYFRLDSIGTGPGVGEYILLNTQ